MKENIHLQRISKLLQRELGNILKVYEKESNTIISVTLVKMTSDNRAPMAKVFLSLYNVKDKNKLLKEIKECKSIIRKELGKRIKNKVRKIPDLNFYLDDSLDNLERIEKLLKT